MTAAPQAPVVCILDSGTNEAGAEGWNYLAGNEDLTDEAGHGDLIYQLLESETPNARLIMLKCFESAEETEEKKGTETITQALYDAVDLWQADVISISWTRNEESEELYEAVCYAQGKRRRPCGGSRKSKPFHTLRQSGLSGSLGRSHWCGRGRYR